MLKKVMIFAAGAIAGTVVGARLVKKRYEEIANEEIEEIRAYYKEKEEQKEEQEESIPVEVPEEKSIEVEERKQYDDIIKNANYGSDALYDEVESSNDPYPIDPSELGNDGHYAIERYTYFADGVLVDDVDEVVEEWELVVGRHHIEIFEEFPDATSVYIRNDLDGTDYEIIKDDWCWSDIQEPEKKPHQL